MTVSWLPSAWAEFGNASMLLWALAGVIPFLLHVWRRRHYRPLDWAAMEFLERAVRQTARSCACSSCCCWPLAC